jgi:hypothetical protein
MLNRLWLFSIIMFLPYGCIKDKETLNSGHLVDINYPTTYHRFPFQTIDALKKVYLADKDSCFQTSLNAFGFCASSDSYNFNCNQNCQSFDQDKASKMVMDFLQKNKSYTGIIDPLLVKINSFKTFGKTFRCSQDSSVWSISIGNQVINGLEIENSGIYLRLDNTGVKEITGNWYPIVYIPKNETFTYELAKKQLLGKQFDFMCWSNIHLSITTDTKWEEPAQRKIIYPLKTNDSIELHVVWVLQTGYFIFYVDVISGKVLASSMTIIC